MKKFSILLVCSLCILTIYGCGSSNSCADGGKYNDDGEKIGNRISCYENGQISSKGKYKDGDTNGKWVYYYENGQVKSKGEYDIGKKDGKRISYNENGEVLSEEKYEDGNLVTK